VELGHHASERGLLASALQTATSGDLWIGDRHFCTAPAIRFATAGAEHVARGTRGTLEAFVEALDPSCFTRISRSHVVNPSFVAELMAWAHGERQVVLRGGTMLTSTRRYKAQ
jgi:hypothetical protein